MKWKQTDGQTTDRFNFSANAIGEKGRWIEFAIQYEETRFIKYWLLERKQQ